MNKYFELRENGQVFTGVIENIPENVSHEEVVERIETKDEKSSIYVFPEISTVEYDVDIVMDWLLLDFEQGMDQDYNDVIECITESLLNGTEKEVVYTSLKKMKNDSDLTISEAIKLGFKEHN